MEALFVKGAILGFAMAAPVGPVGLMTIRTSINRGRVAGLIMAFAVATGDAMYGAVAAFGLTFISDPIIYYRSHIQFFGGFLLLALAAHIYRTRFGKKKNAIVKDRSKLGIFTTTLVFTLSNPSNILTFAAAFAALNMASQNSSRVGASLIVAGVFLGSGLWFTILSYYSSKYRSAFNEKVMLRVNHFAAGALALFACYAIASGFRGLFL